MKDVVRGAVVTGGASGIGLEIARHLAEDGMGVVVIDRDGGACARAAEALAAAADRVRVVTGDIGTPEGAELGVAAAIDAFERIDLLCNNAAVHPLELVEEHSLESWRETFRVNVDGTMLCCRAALPHMRRQGGGAIVNIGSISGVMPYARGAAYAASKAAVAMLTRALALEAGPYGVTVNCICPGSIRHGARAKADPEAVPDGIPVGRRGTPEDVAHLVAYLASEGASYMTGAVIVLDGGATAGRIRSGGRRR